MPTTAEFAELFNSFLDTDDEEERRKKLEELSSRVSAREETMGYTEAGGKSLKRGALQLEQSLYGFTGLAGSLLGLEGVKEWGLEGYKEKEKEIEPLKKQTSLSGMVDDPSSIPMWIVETGAELVPSMAEAAIGAVIGSMIMPGAGTAAGGLASRTLLKKGIEKVVKETMESKIKKGLLKEGTEKVVEEELRGMVSKAALKKLGAQVGMGAAILPVEAGGNYAEVLEEHGIDNPWSALATGAMSTALEYFGGNSHLIGKFFGKEAQEGFMKALKKGDFSYARQLAKEFISNAPEEFAQESGQELSSVFNVFLNTGEIPEGTGMRVLEAGLGGIVGAGMGATIGAHANVRDAQAQQLQERRDAAIANKNKGFAAFDANDNDITNKESSPETGAQYNAEDNLYSAIPEGEEAPAEVAVSGDPAVQFAGKKEEAQTGVNTGLKQSLQREQDAENQKQEAKAQIAQEVNQRQAEDQQKQQEQQQVQAEQQAVQQQNAEMAAAEMAQKREAVFTGAIASKEGLNSVLAKSLPILSKDKNTKPVARVLDKVQKALALGEANPKKIAELQNEVWKLTEQGLFGAKTNALLSRSFEELNTMHRLSQDAIAFQEGAVQQMKAEEAEARERDKRLNALVIQAKDRPQGGAASSRSTESTAANITKARELHQAAEKVADKVMTDAERIEQIHGRARIEAAQPGLFNTRVAQMMTPEQKAQLEFELARRGGKPVPATVAEGQRQEAGTRQLGQDKLRAQMVERRAAEQLEMEQDAEQTALSGYDPRLEPVPVQGEQAQLARELEQPSSAVPSAQPLPLGEGYQTGNVEAVARMNTAERKYAPLAAELSKSNATPVTVKAQTKKEAALRAQLDRKATGKPLQKDQTSYRFSIAEEIPEMKTTQEAIAFGEKATPEQVKELERVYQENLVRNKKDFEEAKASKNFDAMGEVFTRTQANQFYREAFEAAKKEGAFANRYSLGKEFKGKTQLEAKDVKKIVNTLQKDAVYNLPVKVVSTLEDVPEGLAKKGMRAVKLEDHILLVADQFKNVDDVVRVWLHESVGHFGLQSLFDSAETFESFLSSVHKLVPKSKLESIAKEYELDINDTKQRLQVIEEYIADLAESVTLKKDLSGVERTCFQRITDAVKAFLARYGLLQDVTMDDVKSLLNQAADSLFYREEGAAAIETQEAIAYEAMYSVRTLETTQKQFLAMNKRRKIFDEAQVKAFFEAQDNIAARLINERDLFDFTPIQGLSSLKDNSDPQYKKSFDLTTMCKRRYVMQATVDKIQIKLGRALTPNEFMEVRAMLQKKGHQVSCGACYVDSRRIHMATVINKAFEDFPHIPKETFLTYDGITNILPRAYPEEYKEFRKLFGGTQIKIPEGRSEYFGEIAKYNKKRVAAFNRASGLRWQSWSDFEVPHILDGMQAIMDMSLVGLKGHAYTKEANFVEVFAPTGIAINMSLIPKGTGLKKDGSYDWDEKQSFPLDRVQEFRDKFPHVGVVAIGVSDEHIRKLLADPDIDYVIPYHRSGLNFKFQEKAGMSKWTDYESEQNARDATTGKPATETNNNREVYWAEFQGDADKFDQLHKERNITPRFVRMRDWPGYFKLIIDRRTFAPDGSIIEQHTVVPDFDMDAIQKVMDNYEGIKDKPDMGVADTFLKTAPKEAVIEPEVLKRREYSQRTNAKKKAEKAAAREAKAAAKLKENAEPRYSIKKFSDEVDDPAFQHTLAHVGMSSLPTAEKMKKFEESRWDRFVKNVADFMRPVKILEEKGNVDIAMSGTVAHRLLSSVDNIIHTIFSSGTPKYQDHWISLNKQEKGGLFTVIKALEDDAEPYFLRAMAKSAKEVLDKNDADVAAGKESRFTKGSNLFGADKTTGKMLNDREQIHNLMRMTEGRYQANKAAWDEAEQHLKTINKGILDFLVDSGLVSEKHRAVWERENYIPFSRQFTEWNDETLEELFPTGDDMKKVGKLHHLSGGKANVGDPMTNLVNTYSYLISQALTNVANKKVLATFLEHDLATATNAGSKSMTFTIRHNGKAQFYKVEDPVLWDTLKEMNGITNNSFTSWLSKPKQWLTTGVTVNPAFRVKNFLRDTMSTAFMEKSFNPFIDSFKGLVGAWRQSDEMLQYAATGGAFAGSYATRDVPIRIKRTQEGAEKMLESLKKKSNLNPKEFSKKMWAWWEKVGSASENAARLGTYMKMRKKGASELEAGFTAKDLLDFNLHGKNAVVKQLIQLIPFLNARIQGLYKFGRAMSSEKNRSNLLLRGTVLAALAIMLHGLNKDDDDYKELQDYEKWGFFHINTPDGGKFKYPVPFEIGIAFGVAPVVMYEVLSGEKDWKYFGDFVKYAREQNFAMDWAGIQMMKPMLQQLANKDFYRDTPIVPQYKEKLAPMLQVGDRTTHAARALGEFFGELGLPEEMQSPLRIDKFMQDSLATIGVMSMDILSMIVDTVKSYPEDPATHDNYLMKALGIQSDQPMKHTRSEQKFYELKEEVDTYLATASALRKQGRGQELREYTAENRDLAKYGTKLTRISKQVNQIQQKISLVNMSMKLTAEEKRARIDTLLLQRSAILRRVMGVS